MLHTQEVTGSSPVVSTTEKPLQFHDCKGFSLSQNPALCGGVRPKYDHFAKNSFAVPCVGRLSRLTFLGLDFL